MSFNKAIKFGKEHRRQYVGAKNVSPHCRNHGGCYHCLENRMYKLRKTVDAAESRVKDAIDDITAKVSDTDEK